MRLATTTAFVLVAALLLAACGSSKKSSSASTAAPSSSTTATTSSSAPAKTQELELYDFRFDPKTIKGKPGQKVTLELKNEGKVEHNFTVDSLNIDKDLEKGKKSKVTLTLPKSGTLTFYCKYHKASYNMVGSINVGGASSSAPPPSTNTTNSSSSGGSGY